MIRDVFQARVNWLRGQFELDSLLVQKAAEAICFPSFSHNAFIRVTKKPAATIFEFASQRDFDENDECPHFIREARSVPHAMASQFWKAIQELDLQEIQDDEQLIGGRDGMLVAGYLMDNAVSQSFMFFDDETPFGQYLELIFGLGLDVLESPSCIERFVILSFGHGLFPVRVTSNEITHLRLYHQIHGNQQMELSRILKELPVGIPLLVDMTDLWACQKELYPYFRKISKSHSRLAWCVSSKSKLILDELGVTGANVFDNPDAATEWLKKVR